MTGQDEVKDLRDLIVASLEDDKAEDLVVIDLAGKTSIADYMVVASGQSARKVSAMAQHVREKVKQAGWDGGRMEGESQGDWVLIDTGDIIIHLFRPEVRDFYAIEKMWQVDPASTGEVTKIAAFA